MSSLSKALVNSLLKKECALHEHFKSCGCLVSLICPNSTPQFQPEKEEEEIKKDEKPCQQMVESVTSDLTCSITSDLSQVGSSNQLQLMQCISEHPERRRLKCILEQELFQRDHYISGTDP